jgi:ribosomal protein L3 glutamine methyltransferase
LSFPERVTVCELLERRVSERKPAAYLTNRAWFAGLEFYVDENVMVPRSPLAELVEAGFDPWIEPEGAGRILDLCAGSGCIGIACAVYLPDAEVDLAEISTAALQVASRNLELHRVQERVHILESDLFEGVGDVRYDLIVSNPPYVSAAELAALPEEYRKEPQLGFAGGDTGLDLVLRILCDAPEHLEEKGVLVVEVGSTAMELEQRFPDIPFLWLDFERGGEGVFLMKREQLTEFHPLFAHELEKL